MRIKRLISLALALALMLTLAPLSPGSHADETVIKKEDIEVLPIKGNYYELIHPYFHFSEGLLAVQSKDTSNHGYINTKGEVAIPLIYSGARNFSDGHAFIQEQKGDTEYYGLIDKKGNKIIPCEYGGLLPAFSEGLTVLNKDGKYGYLDHSGKTIVEFEYEVARPFHDGLAVVRKNGKWGVIDKKAKVVLEPKYDYIFEYSEGLAMVKEGDKLGFIDTQGRLAIPLQYEIFEYSIPGHYFSKGLAAVQKDGKVGYINKKGEVVIDFEYDAAYPFGDTGLAQVVKNDKFGYIDKTGKIVIPLEYKWGYFPYMVNHKFSDGRLAYYTIVDTATQKKLYGFMDPKGNILLNPKYDFANDFSEGLSVVVKDNKKACINTNFEEVVPFEYDIITRFSEGYALAQKGGQSYILHNKKYRGQAPKQPENYIYDEADKGEGLVLPTDELANVTDKATAAEAVTKAIAGATEEQKTSATGTDLLTLYGEEAALRTAKTEVEGSEFIIDKASVEKIENAAIEAKSAVEGALKDGGVTVQRELSSGVVYEVKEGDKLSVKVDPSSAEAKADNVRVETPTYSLSFNKKALASIKEESAEPLEITVTELPAENAALPRLLGTQISSKAVGANILEDAVSKVFDIKFSKKIKEKIKLSLPVIKGNPNYQAVYDSTGKAIGGKYNPVTKKLDVKINKSDKYVVKEKKKSFADITSKSKEMQDAIEILASKGIIAGTSPTNFSPDGTITRAEIAALILRSISKLNPSENGGFTDVASSDWYFGAVGSAKRHGIMNGVSKTHFAPKKSILKDQIVAVAARVLKEEMGYLAPEGPDAFLVSYTDAASIPNWAKSDVALATREGLVVKRYDSAFIPAGSMTRGDVAVILHRLFKKLW